MISINVNPDGDSNLAAFDQIRSIPAELETVVVQNVAEAAVGSQLPGGGLEAFLFIRLRILC